MIRALISNREAIWRSFLKSVSSNLLSQRGRIRRAREGMTDVFEHVPFYSLPPLSLSLFLSFSPRRECTIFRFTFTTSLPRISSLDRPRHQDLVCDAAKPQLFHRVACHEARGILSSSREPAKDRHVQQRLRATFAFRCIELMRRAKCGNASRVDCPADFQRQSRSVLSDIPGRLSLKAPLGDYAGSSRTRGKFGKRYLIPGRKIIRMFQKRASLRVGRCLSEFRR